MKRHLSVYAKRPRPGYAKTRLGAAIGTEQAAGVYARLLYAYLLDLVRGGLADTRVELSLAWTGGLWMVRFGRWKPRRWSSAPQPMVATA